MIIAHARYTNKTNNLEVNSPLNELLLPENCGRAVLSSPRDPPNLPTSQPRFPTQPLSPASSVRALQTSHTDLIAQRTGPHPNHREIILFASNRSDSIFSDLNYSLWWVIAASRQRWSLLTRNAVSPQNLRKNHFMNR